MILHILRALFILLMAGVGWFFVNHQARPFGDDIWLPLAVAIAIGLLFVAIDILSPRKKLAVFSGTFLGLIVGITMAYALSFLVNMMLDQYLPTVGPGIAAKRDAIVLFVNMVIGMICCYLSISFILQTKDDFRFIIPYVEFSKQVRGSRPIIVDTSAIIDGRIVDVVATGVIDSRLIVPRFVLDELQLVADSADKLKRNRGRRGLETLNKLQSSEHVEVVVYDWSGHSSPGAEGADQKLLVLAKELSGRVLTNDYNLSKVAAVRGVDVINMNELAGAMRPVVLPGERLQVRLIKPGEEPSQGVGFLEDGTMVVVEQGRSQVGSEVELTVTNVLQTSTGRMVFGRLGESPLPRRRGPEKSEVT
jgi:uncharacterized protein YacL